MVSVIAYLVEANVLGLLTEALTAEVEVVLADETSSVLADAATERGTLLAFSTFTIFAFGYRSGRSSSFSPKETTPDNADFEAIGFLIVPAARALAVGARARVPDAFVRHDCGCVGGNWFAGLEGDFARIKVGVNFV